MLFCCKGLSFGRIHAIKIMRFEQRYTPEVLISTSSARLNRTVFSPSTPMYRVDRFLHPTLHFAKERFFIVGIQVPHQSHQQIWPMRGKLSQLKVFRMNSFLTHLTIENSRCFASETAWAAGRCERKWLRGSALGPQKPDDPRTRCH